MLELVLNGEESAEEILALADAHPELRHVDAAQSTQYAALVQLAERLPDCAVDYTVDLGGVAVGSADDTVVLDGAQISAASLIERLAWLPRLTRIDICPLNLPDQDCISVAEAYPEKTVVWTVHFGRWAVRTDAVCFSTLNSPTPVETRYGDKAFAPLFQYCTDLVAIDLGHNNISDLKPLARLKKLQVLILGDNPDLRDITPLGELTELRYVELFMAYYVTDFSCFYNMPHMTDLCIGYCYGLDDISFVDNMPDLQMGWFPMDGVSQEQQEAMKEARPDVHFLFYPSRSSSTSDGWRATEHNLAIRKAFTNWQKVTAFRSMEDIEYQEGAKLIEVYPSYDD